MTTPTKGTDHGFSLLAVLRKGTPVTIRVMRPDDRERLVEVIRTIAYVRD